MSDACYPVGCRPPGSSVHGILQSRMPEWADISLSRRSSLPPIQPGCPALQADSLLKELPGKSRPQRNCHLKPVAVGVESGSQSHGQPRRPSHHETRRSGAAPSLTPPSERPGRQPSSTPCVGARTPGQAPPTSARRPPEEEKRRHDGLENKRSL